MNSMHTYLLTQSGILLLYSIKNKLNLNPVYQRNGQVWSPEKKQLLIDSLINNYDIPKLYFHKLTNSNFDYAVIDGRQRIETIFEFIDGSFHLSEDFEYLQDPSIKLGGLTYDDLSKKYPLVKIKFDSTSLPIVVVDTDDMDLIEDMFSRLNEAVPLNAAEKRNAFGGDLANLIKNQAADLDFFSKKLRVNNTRFQHMEIITRLFFIEYSLATEGKIIDTKKPYLDKLVKDNKQMTEGRREIFERACSILKDLSKIFIKTDVLLRSQASVPIYYLVFKIAKEKGLSDLVSREKLIEFNNSLSENRLLAEADITKAKFEYLEYDRMMQQGTNDASSIEKKAKILADYLHIEFQIR